MLNPLDLRVEALLRLDGGVEMTILHKPTGLTVWDTSKDYAGMRAKLIEELDFKVTEYKDLATGEVYA